MISLEQKRAIQLWMPMAFCAALTAITVFPARSDNSGWTTFVCFLPMCFFGVAIAMKEMRSEILALRKEVAELRQSNAG